MKKSSFLLQSSLFKGLARKRQRGGLSLACEGICFKGCVTSGSHCVSCWGGGERKMQLCTSLADGVLLGNIVLLGYV